MSNLGLSGKKLVDLYNECIVTKGEIEQLSDERTRIEAEIEHRLRTNCSAYDDICNHISELGRWDGLNFISNSRYRSDYDASRLGAYNEAKKILRKWLLDNTRFVEEFVN